MRHAYFPIQALLAVLLLFCVADARAQQAWRPFRPGLIYAYAVAPASGSALIYTLRVDSAYATANGDSVYAFNRLLRTTSASNPRGGSVKSRNNLFGTLLRWRPGQASYTLEATAQADVQAATSLELLPRAAVGSTWTASRQPLRTATLTSRSWQTVSPGVQDSVAVISITAPAATVRLSRRYGLLAGPQWLGGAAGSQLEVALLPASFEESVYSPLRVFDVQPGDEFGYEEYDMGISPIRCYSNKMLRRVISKRLTADSLVIIYQEQRRHEEFGYAGYCPAPAQVAFSPITLNRWALARAGNRWPVATPAGVQVAALRLLTAEYSVGTVPGPGGASYLLAGLPMNSNGFSSCPLTAQGRISYAPHYLQAGNTPATYKTGVDYAAWQLGFGPGVTTTVEGPGFMGLTYYRKTVNGTTQTCGNQSTFAALLPARAALAAALATLHPNPAADGATLTLTQPARTALALRLTDALGRTVWTAALPAGQRLVSVPLAEQPTGLYLLHLSGPATAASWRLVHQ